MRKHYLLCSFVAAAKSAPKRTLARYSGANVLFRSEQTVERIDFEWPKQQWKLATPDLPLWG